MIKFFYISQKNYGILAFLFLVLLFMNRFWYKFIWMLTLWRRNFLSNKVRPQSSLKVTWGYIFLTHFFLDICFVENVILSKLCMIKRQFFHNMKFDLRGHRRSLQVTFFLLKFHWYGVWPQKSLLKILWRGFVFKLKSTKYRFTIL